MARKESAITKVGTMLPAAPQFISAEGQIGTEDLGKYIVPPRIKLMQKQVLDSELAELFGEGDVITIPDRSLICEMERDSKSKPTGESPGFLFVPLFFFVEWCAWNPLSMKGSAPAIRERSCDPSSALAQKCRTPALRQEPHPDNPQAFISNVEQLNFLIAIQGNGALDIPPLLTFSRGSYMRGSAFCSVLRLRKAPIFGCVFQANLVHEQNAKGDWWAIAVSNPSGKDSPWVTDKEKFKEYNKIHDGLVKAHMEGSIHADYEESPSASGTVETNAF